MPGLCRFPQNGFETCFEYFVPAAEHCFLECYFGFPEFCFHFAVGLLVAGLVPIGCGSLVADFHLASIQTNSGENCDASFCRSMFCQKDTH